MGCLERHDGDWPDSDILRRSEETVDENADK
jgi:hypothetical protein